jgi:hypothetical protein
MLPASGEKPRTGGTGFRLALLAIGSIPIPQANNSAGEVSNDDREHETQNVRELYLQDRLSSGAFANFREAVAGQTSSSEECGHSVG